jgi:ABC-type phosphate transport system permease subunit
MIHPQVYHWGWLLLCTALGCFVGIHDLVERREPGDTRSYRITRIVDPLIASGLVVFSVLIILRQFWAIDGLILFFALSMAYHLFILRPVPEAHPVAKWFGAARIMKLWLVFMMFVLGVPIGLLIWLRPMFIGR